MESQIKLFNDGKKKTEDLKPKTITFRVIVLSLLLAAFFGYANPHIDFLFSNTYLGATHLPPGALGALMLLIAVNGALHLVGPRLKLSRNELLTVFITTLFSCLVPGRGGELFFIPNTVGAFYYGTPENKWRDLLMPHLPDWISPARTAGGSYNQSLVEAFYNGGQSVPWPLWIGPICAWAILIFGIYIMLGCLAVILRAQWADYEALTFPLLRLPLEMTESTEGIRNEGGGMKMGNSSFWRNPTMWVGFGIAVWIQGLNGLNYYFPDVPQFPLMLNSGQYFSEAPWNQMGPFVFRVLPLAVGVSYLLSSEVALSFWFFYLLHKFAYIAAYQVGLPPGALPEPTWTRGFAKAFISYQQIGAMWMYAALVLWIGRVHLLHVVKRGLRREAAREVEKDEPLSYPVAFWGFVFSSLVLIGWTTLAGVRWELASYMWLSYFVIALCLTRVVVEGGMLYVNHGWSPLLPLAHLVGAGPDKWFNIESAVPGALVQNSLMIDLKGFLLPSFLQGFKLARDRQIPLRPLFFLIFACIAVAFVMGVHTILNIAYSEGALKMNSFWANTGTQEPARSVKEIAGGVQDSFLTNWLWTFIGGAVTWGLVFARMRFAWFPLHPLGYIMWSPYVMYAFWFSIFLGWLFKIMIMRFGGPETYRRLMPAFLGLILGDVTMMCLINGIDIWQGRTGHNLMPG